MAVEEHSVRAKFCGCAQGHRGMNAETARFVTRRGDDAALVALPPDDHGQAAQFGARQQFNGNKKRVHVDVKNGSSGIRSRR